MAFADYDIGADIWPIKERGKPLAPVRVGVDQHTGKILIGQRHADQSLTKLFGTRYHERILRPWVGSFVPHMLGENTTERTVTRFFWAFATAVDLWEPNYTVQWINVLVSSSHPEEAHRLASRENPPLLNPIDEVRQGHMTFEIHSVYRPRGHLGDPSPEQQRMVGVLSRGNRWDTI